MKTELKAQYIGEQDMFDGTFMSFFNIVDDSGLNVLNESTVSLRTILRLGIKKVLDKSGKPMLHFIRDQKEAV